jgi:hemerythrin-like domain-containing protein
MRGALAALAMTQIRDALELLTAQHEELDELLDRVTGTGDATAFAELADLLASHLALEQELLYPVVAKQISLGTLDEILAEHHAMKRVLADLVWRGIEDDEFATKLNELDILLIGHSSWQEEELFTMAAETLTAAELGALSDRFFVVDALAVAA